MNFGEYPFTAMKRTPSGERTRVTSRDEFGFAAQCTCTLHHDACIRNDYARPLVAGGGAYTFIASGFEDMSSKSPRVSARFVLGETLLGKYSGSTSFAQHLRREQGTNIPVLGLVRCWVGGTNSVHLPPLLSTSFPRCQGVNVCRFEPIRRRFI